MKISKSQFKAKALEYFRTVEVTGRAIIVTDHGRPTVEIRPYSANTVSPLTVLRDSVRHYEAPYEPVGVDDWDALK